MNKYAIFLRDFANANADSFEPEQIAYLHEAADEMDVVVSERDKARMEVCELSGNGSCDSTEREAESRGWKYLFAEENPTYVCDHCAAVVDSNNAFHYAELPRDIASANAGEAATLCRKCEEMIDADANNEYFKKNHR